MVGDAKSHMKKRIKHEDIAYFDGVGVVMRLPGTKHTCDKCFGTGKDPGPDPGPDRDGPDAITFRKRYRAKLPRCKYCNGTGQIGPILQLTRLAPNFAKMLGEALIKASENAK